MFISITRFIANGWVHSMYIAPKVFFPFFGLDFIQPLPGNGMYLVFGLMLLASLGIILGAFYRLSSSLFFLLFTYVELIDKTNYLNHYYFVSLVSFLIIFMPAAASFSVDNVLFKRREQKEAARIFVMLLQLQLFLVYFFAGVAKLNYDWLIEAQPLRTWLPAFSHFPVIGQFMEMAEVAYLFAWFGCIYDLSIGFFLMNRRTVNVAYFFVVIFHLATSLFFNIGMFPYIMITITVIFFRESFHLRILNRLKSVVCYKRFITSDSVQTSTLSPGSFRLFYAMLLVYFTVQIVMPFRYLFYEGKLFWTEQGYRFSWRVMLMEKAGAAFFTVKDQKSGASVEVDNKDHLTFMQEKMMATQPDMMVDYARFLKKEYTARGFKDPVVTVMSYVTVNGRGSREFVDPAVDLASVSNSLFENKNWVRSY